MALKLSRSMDDPRLPGAGGGTPVPQPPMGAASGMPEGLLKPNGALVGSPAGITQSIAGPSYHTVGKPQSNR
jgi:hypothetical protein